MATAEGFSGNQGPLPLRPDDPARLGDYILLGRLGEGGMGVVYLGRARDGRWVVIKVLRAAFADDETAVRRLRREVEAARRVPRYCTAPILDAAFDVPNPYIVTEYVKGPTLQQAIDEYGSLGDVEVYALALGVAAGLTAIHGVAVIHGDLNPDNVILSDSGPRITDFGIARAPDQGTHVTDIDIVVGTPKFLAPESFDQQPITAATDIFAWGGLTVFAATGRPAFGHGSIQVLAHRIMTQPPDLTGVPEDLNELVSAALSKDPRKRPSAEEVVAMLKSHTTGAGARALIRAAEAPPKSGVESEVPSVLARPHSTTRTMRPRALSDHPAEYDLVGVKPLVDGLEALLGDVDTVLPLAVALTAPWGVGKSSVMLQLKYRLDATRRAANLLDRRWHTVSFEAWKYEQSERLWAALAKRIYDEPQRAMSFSGRVAFRVRLEIERLGLPLFLLRGLGLPLLIGMVALVAFAFTARPEGAGALLPLVGVAGTFIISAGRFWGLVGSPFKHAVDRHVNKPKYQEQLGFTYEAERDIQCLTKALLRRPQDCLAVFVDDLDRCSSQHVVEVIEAVNQIFNSGGTSDPRRCAFILGMDRDVVAASVEVAYQDTVRRLQEQGNPLGLNFGLNFLAKVVQLSVAIPEPSHRGTRRLIREVTGMRPPHEGSDDIDEDVIEDLEHAINREQPANPLEVRSIVHRIRGSRDLQRTEITALEEAERRVRAALFTIDSEDVALAEYDVLRFIGRNPRNIKRFDNAFRLQLQVANQTPGSRLEFSRDELIALGKWVALRIRWPELARALDQEPSLLEVLETHFNGTGGDPSGQISAFQRRFNHWFETGALARLLRSEPERRLSKLPLDSFLHIT